jgi:hypothetical protein
VKTFNAVRSKAGSLADGGVLDAQTLTLFMKTHPVAGTLSERVFTGLDGEQALIREKNIYKHLLITLGVS